MFFKNLAIYLITDESFAPSTATLEEALSKLPFKPCGGHDEFSVGFVPPVGENAVLARLVGSVIAFCFKSEDKVLPASAINEQLAKKVQEIEEREARKLPAKERARLKDELIFNLLPSALTTSKKIHGYIDIDHRLIVIDSASTSKSEGVLSALRKCLGSLPVVPIPVASKPSAVMTQWLSGVTEPEPFTVGDECELKSPEEGGGTVRCKNIDLHLPEIKNHIDNGKQITKLALSLSDRSSFVVDNDFRIKKLKFLDLVQEQVADVESESEFEVFDADYTIMAAETYSIISRLVSAFGGLQDGSDL